MIATLQSFIKCLDGVFPFIFNEQNRKLAPISFKTPLQSPFFPVFSAWPPWRTWKSCIISEAVMLKINLQKRK